MPCPCWSRFGSVGSRQRSSRIRRGAAARACGGTSWRVTGFSSGLMRRCFAEMLAGGSRTRPRFNVRWNRYTSRRRTRSLWATMLAGILIGAQNAGLRPVLLRPSVPVSDGCVGINRLSDVLDLLDQGDPCTAESPSTEGRLQAARQRLVAYAGSQRLLSGPPIARRNFSRAAPGEGRASSFFIFRWRSRR